MLVTADTAIYERAAFLRDHGRTPEGFRYYFTTEIAFKYKMSSLQAAFGRAQLERVAELVGKKRQIFHWYEERLRDVPGITLNAEPPETFNSFWMPTAVVDASYGLTNRDMMAFFDKEAIETRPFFPPLSSIPAFRELPDSPKAARRNSVAYDISPRSLNFPSALSLTETQVDRVCERFKALLRRE